MKVFYFILSLFLVSSLLAKPPGDKKESERTKENSQGRNSHNREHRPHEKIKLIIPEKGSLWKFRKLKEDVLFIVVEANEETISYKKLNTTELPTKCTKIHFLHHFKPHKTK